MLNLKELSPANPNTFGHGFEKHYLLQIYSIPDQWGTWVNIELYSSEKRAAVPAMLWWNHRCIRAMILGLLFHTRAGTKTEPLDCQCGRLIHMIYGMLSWKSKFYFILGLFLGGFLRSRCRENLLGGTLLLLPWVENQVPQLNDVQLAF